VTCLWYDRLYSLDKANAYLQGRFSLRQGLDLFQVTLHGGEVPEREAEALSQLEFKPGWQLAKTLCLRVFPGICTLVT